MSTIFPGSASVGQVFDGYSFDGTAWNINGIDLNTNYLEESSASAIYLTQVNASSTYQPIVANISNTEIGYLDGVTSSIQNQIDAKLASSTASSTYLTQTSASTTYATKTGGTFTGNITAPEVHATTKLVAEAAGGDEGGEILLGKPATNSTIAGSGVTIDVYQNRLRIFEQGGNARGVSIDITNTSNGVGTELTPGLGGVPYRMAAGVATVGSNSPVSVTFPAGRFSVAPIVNVTGNSGWSWISNLTSTGVVVYQTTSWGGASQAGSMYWTAVQMTSGAAGG